jgi:RHS repeat-associated protein
MGQLYSRHVKDGACTQKLATTGGNTSLTLDETGAKMGEMKYTPYGETRFTWGSTPTDRRYTGQRQEDSSLGSLYDFNARIYSPALGQFLSADTIVLSPSDPQDFNRYAYTLNNPIRYNDPGGHCIGPLIWVCAVVVAVGVSLIPSSEPYHPYASAQYHNAIASAAQQYGVPEIALAVAVDLQSAGLVSEHYIYTFDKGGDHSWGVGQIRLGEDRVLSGRVHSIEELQNPETSIDLLARKMAMAKQNYGKYCEESL